MSHINTVALSGNLTRDPEKKVVGDDFTIVNLGLAVNESRKNKDTGDYEEKANFFDVTVFGKFGDLVDRKCRKGDAVTVQGKLEYQSWETEDGSKRSKVVVIARELDGACFYKKDEDVKAKESGVTATTGEARTPQGDATDDDIPF